MLLAHRAAWELESGPIPDGLHCCHHCDNPPCVNVNHLFLGTDADNMADKEAKGRGNQAKGSAHVRAKLTEEDIPGIRSLLAMGASHTYLARIYGVGHTTIGSINTGKAWSHV
ncbi:MAG: HNH endonuclease [bacterium]|nr:HNH endonuclease [bacterium]